MFPSPAGSKIEKTQLSEDWSLWALKQSYCIHTLNRGCFSRDLAELISLSGPLLVCMYVCACIFMYVCTGTHTGVTYACICAGTWRSEDNISYRFSGAVMF